MAMNTNNTRNAAFNALRASGYTCERVARNEEGGKGARWIVDIRKGAFSAHAQVKSASRGSALARSPNGTDMNAPISGIDDHVDHILFAVRLRGNDTVIVYLVPRDVAEAGFRDTRREWLEAKKTRNHNDLWTVVFDCDSMPDCNDYATKWKNYAIATGPVISAPEPDQEDAVSVAAQQVRAVPLTLSEAKAGLALTFDVDVTAITITVSS